MTMPDVTLHERYLGKGAASYNEVRQTSARWRLEHETVARLLTPHAGKTILDLPVGTGRFVPIYKDLSCAVIGIDYSPDMLQEAKREAEKIEYTAGRFEEGDATTIDPRTITADVSVVLRFLNWLPAHKAEAAFRNIANATREEMIVSLTSIDPRKFDEKRRPIIERRLANAHSKPAGEGLPPNGPHNWTDFTRWAGECGFSIAQSFLIVEGKDHLRNEIHHLVLSG